MKRPAIADHAGPNGVPTTPLRSGTRLGSAATQQAEIAQEQTINKDWAVENKDWAVDQEQPRSRPDGVGASRASRGFAAPRALWRERIARCQTRVPSA
jgi:hypothetical protein